MEMQNANCCCDGAAGSRENCIICGKPLVYFKETRLLECSICHNRKEANASCEDGHFVCDECHVTGRASVLNLLLSSPEKDPIRLYLDVCALPEVHLHGPEHHSIVPCVLLTACRNCGGEIDLEECLQEAWLRGKKIPGGACGFLGVCGAAAGAGIFASILSEATPLTAEVWDVPQRLTMECLKRMVEVGGPRCCKRTGRMAIETAAAFSREHFALELPVSSPACGFSGRNRECLRERCPYFGGKRET